MLRARLVGAPAAVAVAVAVVVAAAAVPVVPIAVVPVVAVAIPGDDGLVNAVDVDVVASVAAGAAAASGQLEPAMLRRADNSSSGDRAVAVGWWFLPGAGLQN